MAGSSASEVGRQPERGQQHGHVIAPFGVDHLDVDRHCPKERAVFADVKAQPIGPRLERAAEQVQRATVVIRRDRAQSRLGAISIDPRDRDLRPANGTPRLVSRTWLEMVGTLVATLSSAYGSTRHRRRRSPL